MKELSIEEKAKAYDEALEIARQYWNDRAMPIGTNFKLERMFPELRESEDERIRKALINMFKGYHIDKVGDFTDKEILAWLEKQCEKPKKVSIWKHWKNGLAGNGDGKLIYLVKDGNNYSFSSCLGFECDYIELSELDKLLYEKQGEQKSADKVEPKFHEGEWLVNVEYGNVVRVLEVLEDNYRLDYGGYTIGTLCTELVDNDYRLWTIQDAKDGDVLATGDEIFIHNGKLDLIGRVCAYCGIYKTYNELRFNCAANNYFTYIKPHPATKEQRDTLMKVMTDAGYTFDFEKKELKKIEQKPQRIVSAEAKEAMYDKLVEWSEEDKEIVEALGDYVKNLDILFSEIKIGDKNILSKEFREKVQSWLKCLKERVQPQPKQKWNEEDERNASYICAALDCYYRLREDRNNTNGQEDLDKARNWLYNKLKSLRPQNSSVTDEELAQAKKDAYNDALYKIEYHSGEPTFDDGWHAAIWYLKKRNTM